MRFPRGLLVGLAAAGLVGCSNSGFESQVASPSAPAASPSAPATSPSAPAASPSAPATTETRAAAPPASPAQAETKAGARAAAARFYSLYFGGQFAASWDLLAPAVKRQVPKSTWIGVHVGCPPARAGKPRVITSVTVFGNAAIVTEKPGGARPKHGKTEDVFNYSGRHWGYSPGVLSIYHHGSVAADVAAAKAAGFCTSREASPL